MQTIKGPSLHLAQFADNKAPFNSLEDIARWAAGVGFKGLQIPAWDQRLFDVATAASSQTYCDDVNGMLASHGLVASELTTHIFGQLVAVHPAYDAMCDSFAPEALRGNPAARTAWALEQLKLSASASRRMGLSDMGTFSGSFVWPYLFPFPQRPAGLIETAFEELARRWRPILDACDEQGVNLCYEIHPSEDLHDGTSFERFHELVGQHARCKILFDPSHFVLQQLNYLDYIDIYREHIRMFHVKDAEFLPAGARASTAAIPRGWSGQGVSVRWATGRWTSRPSSPSSPSTTTRAGPRWNGSAASRTRKTVRARAWTSSTATSSA